MSIHHFAQQKLRNTARSVGALLALSGLAVLVGYVIAGGFGSVLALMFAGIGLLLMPRLSPRLLLRMTRARPLPAWQAPALHRLVRELSARAKLAAPPRLYLLPSPAPNAMAVGHPSDAAIAVSSGLLRNLSWREIAGVLAHEISHLRSDDVWLMTLASILGRLTSLLSFGGLLLMLITLPLILAGTVTIAPLAVLLLLAAPLLSGLLVLGLSRAREFDADLGAAELTGDPRGLASALVRIEHHGASWLARLFFRPRAPVEEAPEWLRTHPVTSERVRRLLELNPAL